MTHDKAKMLFGKCRNKERGYKLANNTYLRQKGGAFSVRLHKTDIVTIRPDGTYRLNSGGWRTKTTKTRMNEILPGFGVLHTAGIWSIGDEFFTDGMLVGQDGQAVVRTRCVQETLKTKKRVDYYCAQFIRKVSNACIGGDIGHWDTYKQRGIPNASNPRHLTELWNTIANATWKDPGDRVLDIVDIRLLLYIATIDHGYSEPRLVWDISRDTNLHFRDSFFHTNNLRKFLQPRKPFIADMIVSGELEIKPRHMIKR